MRTILLVTTKRGPCVARLALAFVRVGCRVDAVVPSGHVLTRLRVIHRLYPYRRCGTLRALAASIRDSAPDFILACDDTAVIRLHQLSRCAGHDPTARWLSERIERALGDSAACWLATRRGELMALAQEENIRIPETARIRHVNELKDWLSRGRLPAVVKSSGTCGGNGVVVVHSLAEADMAFAAAHARPGRGRMLKRLIVNWDPTLLKQQREDGCDDTIVQSFVADSHPANRAVACWQGEVLAGISVRAIVTSDATGPSTIVEVIDHPEMTAAAIKIVRRLGLSGFCGLDFMLTRDRRTAYLIEVNPRATPISHLALGPGRDLLAAIVSRLQERPTPETAAVTRNNEIALFPNAWLNNSSNPHLQTAYHDVPWEDADLVQACMEMSWRRMNVWKKARRWWRRPVVPPLRPPMAGCFASTLSE